MEGSPSKVSRGWDQELTFNPRLLSSDPDDPTDRKFNYTWYCRVVSPKLEEYDLDGEDYPTDKVKFGGQIPNPAGKEPMYISPFPGCFGKGPGVLGFGKGIMKLNTRSFETFSQIYEMMVVISKGDRRARAKIEIDVQAMPSPIISIKCKSQSLCFPTPDGVYVNPTTRLALTAECLDLCDGDLSYEWTLSSFNDLYNISDVSLALRFNLVKLKQYIFRHIACQSKT